MNIWKRIYKEIKRNQFFYFFKMSLGKEYKKKRKLMNASNVKAKEIVKKEMQMVEDYWGCKPLHYIRYGLYNVDLSDEQILDYIPPYYFYTRYNEVLFSNYDKNFDNKLFLYYEFRKRKINTVPVLAVYRRGRLFEPDTKNAVSIDDIINTLHSGDKLFFKPIDGQGGSGIFVIKKDRTKLLSEGVEIADVLSHLDEKTCYILQKGIIQRDDFMAINSSSVNTLRIITQWNGKTSEVKVCVMRMGRNGKDVDNSHQGGLSVQINVNTGEMFPTATAEHGGGKFVEHPDTHYVFKNNTIRDWKSIKSKIEDYASRIPEIKEIAWDVAVTDFGVVIIELNTGYGIDHLQCCCGGLRRVLDIYPN